MKSNMSISIIIINWNGGELLANCLGHMLKQTLLPDQILVMDNASTDDSAICAANISGVDVYFFHENLGFAAANNRALELCTTDWVVLLNPDAFAEPEWLSELLKAAELFPEVSAFGSRQMIQGVDNLVDGIGDCYHFSGLAWRDQHGKLASSSSLKAGEIFAPCAAAAMYRRQALLDVGGFDEDFFCYMEDVDLGFRLRLAGHKARYVPGAVVYHVGSATTGGQRSEFSVYHGHRNLVWTYVKNMPSMLFWLLLPVHLMLNVFTLIFFAGRGQGRTLYRAKVDAVKGLAVMWQKRQQIQKNRTASVMDVWKSLDKWPINIRNGK